MLEQSVLLAPMPDTGHERIERIFIYIHLAWAFFLPGKLTLVTVHVHSIQA